MSKYDIVVVGAGNGGLVAALECASKGKKTLLIEQHNLPGGCATSFVRGRFEIEPSLHELCGVGSEESPGNVRSLLESFGVKVDWCKVNDCFRVISVYSDGSPMDVTMPTGVDEFIEKMEFYVPGSRDKMRELFELFDEVDRGLDYLGSSSDKKGAMQFPNLLKAGSYSTHDVFKALKLPQKCQDILSTYWSYLGVDMENLSFIHYASMVHSYVKNGAYIPAHTSHEISVKMTERFREMGGEIWYNCRAEDFIFKGDRLIGVNTTMGKVYCDYCLANINSDIVYGRMVPSNLVPDREKKLANARNGNYGGRMITAYFGLDCTAEELGIEDYSIFLAGTSDSLEEYSAIMQGMKHNEFSIFLCYNIANPAISPEGTCLCSFTTFGSPIDFDNLSPADYYAFKTFIARKFMKSLKDKTGIDISDHIEEVSVATPWTFARYLGTPEGSVYGHETSGWDAMIARAMTVATDYPIKGLKHIGADGPRGDGYSSAYACGQILAEMALAELANGSLSPVEEVSE